MSAAASHVFPEFYSWSFSGAPLQIQLSLGVVSRLRKQIQGSSNDAGMLSGCGLLTGDTPRPGVTRVLDFKFLQTLDASSVAAATAGASGEVIGFYRTGPPLSVAMSNEDRALAASFFRDTSSVFLLIEIGTSGVGDARFCFWGEGQLFDWPLMLFPFDADELAASEKRRRSSRMRELSQSPHAGLTQVTSSADESVESSPEAGFAAMPSPPLKESVSAHETLPVSPADPALETKPSQPAGKPQPGNGNRWVIRWLISALATVVTASLVVGAFLYLRRGPDPRSDSPVAPARTEGRTPLGLAIEKRDNNLRISWDGSSPVISKADYGMLLIRGSGVSRDVPLTSEELRTGSVVYASPVEEVRFQLNVVSGEHVAREFLTVLLPKTSESPTGLPTGLTNSKSGASKAEAEPQPTVISEPAPRRELKQFKQVERSGSNSSAPLRIQEPPLVIAAAPVATGIPSLPNPPPVSMPAPIEVPAQKIAEAEPSHWTDEAYPPVATHRVVPAVPQVLKGVLWKATVVDVAISVDASGGVIKAEAVAKPGINPLLLDAAVQAARGWKFRPAQFGGHPVPAYIVLQFSFAPKR